jgi:hypothetical protein
MPMYVYKRDDRFYVSPIILNSKKYKKICVYKELNINNILYSNLPKDCDYHILNSNLVPTRKAFIIIFDRISLKIRLFEPFDVLKDYKIMDSEYSSVIYYINNGIKIHYGKFDIRNFYNVCSGCKNIHKCKIQKCLQCGNCMCSKCNILDSDLCDDCGINISDLDTDTDSIDIELEV